MNDKTPKTNGKTLTEAEARELLRLAERVELCDPVPGLDLVLLLVEGDLARALARGLDASRAPAVVPGRPRVPDGQGRASAFVRAWAQLFGLDRPVAFKEIEAAYREGVEARAAMDTAMASGWNAPPPDERGAALLAIAEQLDHVGAGYRRLDRKLSVLWGGGRHAPMVMEADLEPGQRVRVRLERKAKVGHDRKSFYRLVPVSGQWGSGGGFRLH